MISTWQIKRLGDVAKISSGKIISAKEIFDSYEAGLFPCYGGNGLRGYVKTYLFDGQYPIIGRVGALCGNVHLANGKFYPTEHALVVSIKTDDNPRFIEYLLKSMNLNQYAKGVAQPVLAASAVSELTARFPSPSEQQLIVDELDLLNGIIEKKNEQLKILDKLAESIFYEMFGVPAESTDTKYPIIDYANCIAGATPSTLVNSYWENGTIPWLSSGEVAKGRISETDTKITQEGYDSCSTRLVPKESVLVAMAGQGKTRGTVGITDIELCTNQSICSIVINKDTLLPTFLYYQLKYLYNELRSISNGDGGRGGLNLKLIGQFKIMVPQIEKQSLFVEKAVFIEKEKLLIKESIKPLEQLLAKRMDKYFSE